MDRALGARYIPPMPAAESDAGFAPLLSERLRLRAITPDDAAALHRLINDWDVARMLGGVPFPYPREELAAWIAAASADLAAGRACLRPSRASGANSTPAAAARTVAAICGR